jgi:hypothetical protein
MFNSWRSTQKVRRHGRLGFGDFKDGKPGDAAVMRTCLPCYQLAKDHDLIFARYASLH